MSNKVILNKKIDELDWTVKVRENEIQELQEKLDEAISIIENYSNPEYLLNHPAKPFSGAAKSSLDKKARQFLKKLEDDK